MNYVIIIMVGIIGSVFTYYVNEHLKQGAVRASALLALIVGLFFYLFPHVLNEYLSKSIPIVFIGTSFIGMVDSHSKGSYLRLAIAGILFSIIYIYKAKFFNGFGGGLGTMAFIALLTTMTISNVISKRKK
ncbi:hypothetical protein [uncultured Nonlabens sp.]|uniref:hypothetical protein n=1 Tax=uncultured Nonlabens sp. TaxID=859306 RepID=UPI0026055E89|nr:hypothetical protein [uncultured Nonlabens sp.]